MCQLKKRRLTIQCDELWSFVRKKANKQWVWLALDVETRLIVGCYVGSRDEAGARGLWLSLPPLYRQCAICYRDFWAAYAAILPSKRHRAVGKERGQTNHVERGNTTLRQRVSRLVRETLAFSKKRDNHIGAIWYFIHQYNTSPQYLAKTRTRHAHYLLGTTHLLIFPGSNINYKRA